MKRKTKLSFDLDKLFFSLYPSRSLKRFIAFTSDFLQASYFDFLHPSNVS